MKQKEFEFLTDGDIIAYRSAAVCEEQWFFAVDPEGWYTEVKGIREARKLEKAGHTLEEFYKYADEYAPMGTVKRTLNNIQHLGGCKSNSIYLSPGTKDTFRYRLAKTAEYKGNRKDLRRPHYLNTCRDYMLQYWKAEVADDMEADDMLGIRQCQDLYRHGRLVPQHEANTAICTVDKDLRMIPGWHVNWVTQETEWISEEGYLKLESKGKQFKLKGGGLMWFYAQLIMGDTTDNIIGPSGFGDKRAYDAIGELRDIKTIENKVLEIYESDFGNDAMDRLIENGRLLWILRDPMEKVNLWKPVYLSA